MKFKLLLFTALLIISCSSKSTSVKTVNKDLENYLIERYNTRDFSLSNGVEINSNGIKKSYIQLSLNNYKNNSQLNDELIASNIFYHLYYSMSQKEQAEIDEIVIELSQNNNSKKTIYSRSAIDKIQRSINFLSTFENELILEKYNDAEALFNTSIIDTSQMDLSQTLEPINKNLGQLKKNIIEGFDLGETDYNGKTKQIIKLFCVAQYEKGNVTSSYTIDLDNGVEKLVHFKIN